jgi:hypothetical protein
VLSTRRWHVAPIFDCVPHRVNRPSTGDCGELSKTPMNQDHHRASPGLSFRQLQNIRLYGILVSGALDLVRML